MDNSNLLSISLNQDGYSKNFDVGWTGYDVENLRAQVLRKIQNKNLDSFIYLGKAIVFDFNIITDDECIYKITMPGEDEEGYQADNAEFQVDECDSSVFFVGKADAKTKN